MKVLNKKEYLGWITDIKLKIRSTQIKASLSVNKKLLNLYWEIGKEISEKVEISGWGKSIVENLSKEIKKEFPNQTGFSRSNLFNMKKWYEFYSQTGDIKKIQQLVALILRGHNIYIISKVKTIKEARLLKNLLIF